LTPKDQKEIKAYDDWIQSMKDESQRLAKEGILYGNASYTDMDLAADAVQEYLDDCVEPEKFIPLMYAKGYEMSVFEGDL